jgi:hypothetical protein
MRRFLAPSSGLDKFFAAQFSAGYITSMSGFDLRQAQWPWNCFGNRGLNKGPQRVPRRAVTMHLHTYRNEDRSRHIDLIGGRSHPWSIDLVAATAAGILVVGFACALVALWFH